MQLTTNTGNRFQAVCAVRGIRPAKVAADLGFSREQVAYGLSGKRVVSVKLLEAVSRYVGPEAWAFIMGQTDTLQAPPLAAPAAT